MDPLYYLILTIVLLVFIILTIYILQKLRDYKNKQKIISILKKYGDLKDTKKNQYQYHYKDETYTLLLWKVPNIGQVTFNSDRIWEVSNFSKPNRINQTKFIQEPFKKMVILYPYSGELKRWRNENELEYIHPDKPIWNMYIIKEEQLETVLSNNTKE